MLLKVEELLEVYADQPDFLRGLVESALKENARLRCAVPFREALNARYPAPQIDQAHAVIAADGSQINPSRHDPVSFGLVNLGMMRMYPGTAQVSRPTVHSTLLYPGAEGFPHEHITEQLVALQRDLTERQHLADAAVEESLPVVALTDGPLEPFREPGEARELRELFMDYLRAIQRMETVRGIPAGYVDKPQADMVVRLLALTQLAGETSSNRAIARMFAGVTDEMLFRKLLKPDERSAVFQIQSLSAVEFREFHAGLAPFFFYLNVGFPGQAFLARVEVPAWVAKDGALLDLLHGCLVSQCRKMGSLPYPYILHRAHEEAVVKFAEKRRVQEMILAEFRRLGVTIGEPSNKQANKDRSGL
jgi:hypothetical protein